MMGLRGSKEIQGAVSSRKIKNQASLGWKSGGFEGFLMIRINEGEERSWPED